MKPSREIRVLLLVTLKAEPNWHAVEYNKYTQGPALENDDSCCSWDPVDLAEELQCTLETEFPKGRGNPYFVKSVKEATAP